MYILFYSFETWLHVDRLVFIVKNDLELLILLFISLAGITPECTRCSITPGLFSFKELEFCCITQVGHKLGTKVPRNPLF